ncbi:hypothetical protein BVRB_5g103130 [Beta vulgaris subsp. vulgaris]|nr:hypothetical protein BVRB_5g103130 [Beta vulgaris subsp. vulgaris]
MKDIDTKRPRRLDLDAPLMSARRCNIMSITSIEFARTNSLHGSCGRVPFSWEQSPGKPKDAITRENLIESDKALPLPKPPVIRWQEDDNEDCGQKNGDDGSFSDAIDLFSLAGSLNTSERLDLESDFNGDNGSLSPNFMIQRFLPAATALAASSISALATNNDNNNSSSTNNLMEVYSSSNYIREGSCVPKVTGEAFSTSKGCGFQVFFPWRPKHRICGVKSPVRRVQTSLKLHHGPKK